MQSWRIFGSLHLPSSLRAKRRTLTRIITLTWFRLLRCARNDGGTLYLGAAIGRRVQEITLYTYLKSCGLPCETQDGQIAFELGPGIVIPVKVGPVSGHHYPRAFWRVDVVLQHPDFRMLKTGRQCARVRIASKKFFEKRFRPARRVREQGDEPQIRVLIHRDKER